MTKRHHVTGRYISRSHTTAITLTDRIAEILSGSGIITKVSLGKINARASCRTEKVVIHLAKYNLRLFVQQSSATQELYVSAPDRERVIACLVAWCQEQAVECIVRPTAS